MEKLVIIHNKPKEDKQTIKQRCFDLFGEGLSIADVIEQTDIKLSTAKYYRQQYVNTMIYSFTRHNPIMFSGKKEPFSSNEMDYGSNPIYNWEDLETVEKQLIKHKNHKQLSKI